MKVSIRIAAVASLSSLALVAATNVAVLAAPDPDNHGHHYGQLKHHPVTAPSPIPTPVPVPTPTSHPVVQPTPSVAPVIPTPRPVNVPVAPVQQPAASPQASPIAVPSPVQVTIQVSQAAASTDENDWLLLLLLPTLIAIWLIAAVGLARRLSGVSRRVLQAEPAPA